MEFHELAPEHNPRNLVTRLEKAGFQVVLEKTIFDDWVSKLGKIWAIRGESTGVVAVSIV